MAASVANAVVFSGSDVSTVTSSPVTTTTGSTFLVWRSKGNATGNTPTDNKGNTYTRVSGMPVSSGGAEGDLYYCQNGTGGSGHTATATTIGNDYPACFFIEITGVGIAPVDFGSIVMGARTSPFSITSTALAQADSLVLTFSTIDSGANPITYAVSGFTGVASQPDGGNFWASAAFQKNVTSTAAVTATWTFDSGSNAGQLILALKSAASGTSVTPDVGSVALSGHIPTVARTANQAVAPGVGALTLAGFAPTVSQSAGLNLTPGVAALSLTGYAPTLAQTANQSLTPGVGSLALTGYAPTISQPQAVSPGVGASSLTGFAPTVAQTENQGVSPGTGTLALTGYAPSIAQTANQAEIGRAHV